MLRELFWAAFSWEFLLDIGLRCGTLWIAYKSLEEILPGQGVNAFVAILFFYYALARK